MTDLRTVSWKGPTPNSANSVGGAESRQPGNGAASGFGWRLYALGVTAMGGACLAIGDFLPGETVSKTFPERATLALAAGVFLLAAGVSAGFRRTAAWSAAALNVYFGLVVVVLMNAHATIAHYREFSAYSSLSEQLALAAGGLIILAARGNFEPAFASKIMRMGQITFGICAVLFGGAHFFYMKLTAPLVPAWLPPSQLFWGYATGFAHVAGGVAIITGVKARPAAILLTIMYASFTPLVHIPLYLAHPSDRYEWTENALNLALTGVAWVVAESLSRRRREVQRIYGHPGRS